MGAIRNAWLKWKMLRLPWRKKFFVGQDLSGNTFWEFRDVQNPLSTRLRRIVHKSPYAAPNTHYADIPISPQWHQWLRQARPLPPTLAEQQGDIARQSLLKENARLADERWEAKGRYIEKPKPKPKEEPQQMFKSDARVMAGREGMETKETRRDEMEGVMSQVDNPVPMPDVKDGARQQAGMNPGGEFQPEAWTPGAAKKRSR